MIGVGHEQWGPQYIERWEEFKKAIKQRYPDIQFVSSVGPSPDGEKFNFLNDTLRKLNADILDEHYYRSPQWFLDNVKRYDHYDRSGVHIFAGEYAAQSKDGGSPESKNNWQCALAEAAFMTGLERNADVVHMASYAPLFAHVEGWQWTPDLIWFDNLRSYGTPDYYVQQFFSLNKGTDVVPMTLHDETVTGQDGCFASAVLDKKADALIIKLINTSGQAQEASFVISGAKGLSSTGSVTTLQSNDLSAVNSLDEPGRISPRVQSVPLTGDTVRLNIKPYSVNVIRVGEAGRF